MAFVENLRKIWTLPDLRRRVLFVILLLLITRLFAHIPLPGVQLDTLRDFFSRNQLFGILDMFSGGSISRFSIILMGVGPYITSSIIIQLLTVAIPSLEALQKEGEFGRHKINQYTRWLTIPMAIIQAYGMLAILRSQGIVISLSTFDLITVLIAASAGTIFLMWIGELISENGIGNGISLIITLGIIAGLPVQVRNTFAIIGTGKIGALIFFGVLTLITIGFIVLVTEGERQIPVTYARRIRMGATIPVESHLPLRVNTAGVIPIIFAISFITLPGVAARFFQSARTPFIANSASAISKFFENNLYYGIIYFILVIAFTYFYTSIVFKPDEVAENLQKQGGFIPGIRPGRETSTYLKSIMSKITLPSSIFLGIIAVLPFLVQAATGITTLVLGGTSILIIVAVIIETMKQFQAQLVMKTYENL